ncbi:hypothetical protein ACIPT3_14305 [Streptomyces diastaticus]|uniref:hypothetical protein n=1 Tax=Streptomyces diastaticus TaxID=1956 RepID=UPI0038248515
MKITVEGASEEFERELLDLVAEHRHELAVTADTEWTVERAERYLRLLTATSTMRATTRQIPVHLPMSGDLIEICAGGGGVYLGAESMRVKSFVSLRVQASSQVEALQTALWAPQSVMDAAKVWGAALMLSARVRRQRR